MIIKSYDTLVNKLPITLFPRSGCQPLSIFLFLAVRLVLEIGHLECYCLIGIPPQLLAADRTDGNG